VDLESLHLVLYGIGAFAFVAAAVERKDRLRMVGFAGVAVICVVIGVAIQTG